MTTYSYELASSRGGRSAVDSSPQMDMVYHVGGLSSSWLISDAVAELLTVIPAAIADPLTSVPLVPTEWTWSAPQNAYQAFEIHVRYTDGIRKDNTRQLQPGEIRWSCDTTGGKLHINCAISEKGRYVSQWDVFGQIDAPDLRGAIEVTRQGEARGTEIIVPAMRREVEYRFSSGIVSENMVSVWEKLTGSVNSERWKKKDAGEVLFAGAIATNAWSPVNIVGPQVKFSFLTAPNRRDWTVGPFSHVDKDGWDYMWVWFEADKPETPTGSEIPIIAERPIFLYVDQVYPREDFAQLGIGT